MSLPDGLGCAEASLVGDEWFINRVLVRRADMRSQGIGGMMLEKLKELIKERGGTLIVGPGGYSNRLEDQIRFYERHGFVRTKDHRGEFFKWEP